MSFRKFEFRSIKINDIEKILPHSGETVTVREMDENSIEKHNLDVTLTDIFRNGTWGINFFLSLMVTAAHAGIVFAAFTLLSGNSSSGKLSPHHQMFLIISSIVLFSGLWFFFSIRGGAAKMKHEFVINERGGGNWKIINEDKFDNFYRLLLISKKRSNNS